VEILGNVKDEVQRSENDLQEDTDYEMLAFVLCGSIRKKIFTSLMNRPTCAYKIAHDEGLNVSSVYRALKMIEQKKVIRCLNPESHRLRFFVLTQSAWTIAGEVIDQIDS
jgi:hypothetical protein